MVRALNKNKSKLWNPKNLGRWLKLFKNCFLGRTCQILQIYFSFFPFHQNYLTSQLIGFMMEFHRQVNKEKNIYEFLQESFVEFEPKKVIYSYLFKFPRSEQAEIQLNSLFYWIILKSEFRNKLTFFGPLLNKMFLPGYFQKCQKVFSDFSLF